MSRSRRAARWLQPGLVVKRWMLTSGIGLLLALQAITPPTAGDRALLVACAAYTAAAVAVRLPS
mgnify:CR=1 FL=1